MDRELLIQALVTIGVGAISGGITNAVAIWMLFHPYDSRGIGPFRIQGAIPKNKARLARSIGRTVGERLLTPEDLAAAAQRTGGPRGLRPGRRPLPRRPPRARARARCASSSTPSWPPRSTRRSPDWRRGSQTRSRLRPLAGVRAPGGRLGRADHGRRWRTGRWRRPSPAAGGTHSRVTSSSGSSGSRRGTSWSAPSAGSWTASWRRCRGTTAPARSAPAGHRGRAGAAQSPTTSRSPSNG